MFRVFYGPNRLSAEKSLKKFLGDQYEVYEGENLQIEDLPSIFMGTSLFETGKRRILLKNLSDNAAVWEKVADYVTTEHEVVIWEEKIDKRSAGYKRLKELDVSLTEFAEEKKADAGLVFGILETALRDGKRAVKDVEKIELTQDPYMFFGLMVTQALKKFDAAGGKGKWRVILKELGELDIQMKSTGMEPWLLIKGFLLRVGSY